MATIIETQVTPTPAADQTIGWRRIGKLVRERLAALTAGLGWLGLCFARIISSLDVRVVDSLTIAAGTTLVIAMLSGRTAIAAVAAPLALCGIAWIAGYRRGYDVGCDVGCDVGYDVGYDVANVDDDPSREPVESVER